MFMLRFCFFFFFFNLIFNFFATGKIKFHRTSSQGDNWSYRLIENRTKSQLMSRVQRYCADGFYVWRKGYIYFSCLQACHLKLVRWMLANEPNEHLYIHNNIKDQNWSINNECIVLWGWPLKILEEWQLYITAQTNIRPELNGNEAGNPA